MKFSKRTSKFFNVATIILELLCEIILLPFKIIKAILNVAEEVKR